MRYADRCADCRIDTSFATGIGHFYTVHEELWQRATPDKAHFLCLDCLETRLGRPLVEADFLATPPEILARFAGQSEEVLPSAERQRALQDWRDFSRAGLDLGQDEAHE